MHCGAVYFVTCKAYMEYSEVQLKKNKTNSKLKTQARKRKLKTDVNPNQGRGTQQRKFGLYSSVIASILDDERRDYLQCDRELDQEKKVSIYSSAAAVLLLLHLWLSKKHWKTPPRAVNGAFLWVYWVFAGPDLGSCFHCRLGGWFHPAFPHAQTL